MTVKLSLSLNSVFFFRENNLAHLLALICGNKDSTLLTEEPSLSGSLKGFLSSQLGTGRKFASIKRLPIIKFLDSLLFEKLRKRCMRVSGPCTVRPIQFFIFFTEVEKSNFVYFNCLMFISK